MHKFDAIVVGSGVGGMCAAALLSKEGMRVLVLEKSRYLGGRFSTVNHNGYQCAVGGLAVPVGRNMEQVCDELGIDSGVKPVTRVAVWLDGKFFDLSQGGTRRIIRQLVPEDEARGIIGALNDAMTGSPPSNDITFYDWLSQFTDNRHVHGMFQATIASLLTVNSNELVAREYFEMIKVIAPLTFGFVEGGSLSLWQRMAENIQSAGGQVLTSAAVRRILTSDDRATGVLYRSGRRDETALAPLVISNLGPAATVESVGRENLPAEYVSLIDAKIRPTALLWMHFGSDEQLFDYSAISLGCTRRVNMIDCPSMEAAGVAPEGKHLYTVGAAPLDTFGVQNVKAEFAEVKKDLERVIPGFDDRCQILTQTCYRGKWPGYRTVPGNNTGFVTPIDGLYNVGDASCPSGYFGSMGAAKSAQLVRSEILRR